MKNKIIEESIKSLQREGLRFSVDTLAEKLKISKKTVYKYFPNKETLAYAVYERYYADLKNEIKTIVQKSGQNIEEALLLCYFDSAKMVRKEIFNKYCLNDAIENFALHHHLDIWNTIMPLVCGSMTEEASQIYQLVIDGAFEKAISGKANAVMVIELLRRIK